MTNEAEETTKDDESKAKEKWGFPLKVAYRIALKFYKENDGKAVQLHYDDRLRLVAYTQQVTHGKYAPEKLPPLGAFDVIGRDRRNAWSKLGDMSQEKAMVSFVDELIRLMPPFQPYLQALKASENSPENERNNCVEEEREEEDDDDDEKGKSASTADIEKARAAAERQRQEEDQRRQIQDALNQQTYTQFRSYAEQQYPSNPDQQAVLIRQLQEQHYYQYMQQIYQQQQMEQRQIGVEGGGGGGGLGVETNKSETGTEEILLEGLGNLNIDTSSATAETTETTTEFVDEIKKNDHSDEGDDENDDDNEDGQPHECSEKCGFCQEEEISPASMWTKKDLTLFKESIRKEGGDAIIKVGQGETVTVRVPTHDDGSALFWEFATDNYDIAFGLFFEWHKPEDENQVSVHISDSEDEDLDDDEFLDENDPERAAAAAALIEKGPPTSVIVPIYRRDCHEEVYAGSHTYPGPGVYLLKFDNTYSLWRSKTLYYRVYYTRDN